MGAAFPPEDKAQFAPLSHLTLCSPEMAKRHLQGPHTPQATTRLHHPTWLACPLPSLALSTNGSMRGYI